MRARFKNVLKLTFISMLVLFSGCEAEKDFTKQNKIIAKRFSMKNAAGKSNFKLSQARNGITKINLLFLLCSLSVISCSTKNSCIESYLKEDMANNKGKNVIPVLAIKKLRTSNTLKTYLGIKRGNRNIQAKSFDQNDYDLLYNENRNDTVTEYWSKKESGKFKFAALIDDDGLYKFRDSISSLGNSSEVYNYNLSKPIFIKNKKLALFSVLVTKQPNTVLSDCVIIMKKENGKWLFLEKVNSASLH